MANTFIFKIGPFALELPDGHLLPHYQSQWPRYDKVLGDLAQLIQSKYTGFSAIDIGANVGDTCAVLNTYVRVPTLCIEGSTSFHDCLYRNAARIGSHVAVAPVFVGDPDTTGEHSVIAKNGTASIRKQAGAENAPVAFLSLQTILGQHPEFDSFKLLKVDTDGMDFTILDHALPLISRNRPILFFEYDTGFEANAEASAEKLFADLRRAGYRHCTVYDNFGHFYQSCATADEKFSADLNAALRNHRHYGRAIHYFDVVCFHDEDINLYDALLTLERQRLNLRQPDLPSGSVVVDGVFWQILHGGISRVWTEILTRWATHPIAERLVLLDRGGTAPAIPGIRRIEIPLHDYATHGEDRAMLQRWCEALDARVFISTYYTAPHGTPSVQMIYDMIPEAFSSASMARLSDPMWQEKHLTIARASQFIAISKHSAADLHRYFSSLSAVPITVAYPGRSQAFYPASETEITEWRARHGITGEFFLTVGARTGYKNVGLLFRAMTDATLAQLIDIVCVSISPNLEAELALLAPDARVHMLNLSDDELRAAYGAATALVYPSLYEGFGMPVLEAMACGCPVITCRTSSIPEVGDNAVLYVSSDDREEMIAALHAVRRSEIRSVLRAKGLERARQFSWDSIADALEQAVLDVAKSSDVLKQRSLPDFTLESIDRIEALGTYPDMADAWLIGLRRKLAQFLIGAGELDELDCPAILQSIPGRLFSALIQRRSYDFFSGDEDLELRKALREALAQGNPAPTTLMAAMLYLAPHQLGAWRFIAGLPLSLHSAFAFYASRPPTWFRSIGEIDEFCDEQSKILATLEELTDADRQRIDLFSLAEGFLAQGEFWPADMAFRSGRGNCTLRDRMVERILRWRQKQLDYKFPFVASRSRTQVAIFHHDFHAAPETFASLPLIKHLDRSLFHVTLLSLADFSDPFASYCSHFADACITLPSELNKTVQEIRAKNFDIIWMASDATASQLLRYPFAAFRLARHQIIGGNFPAISGFSNVDFMISGRLTEQRDAAQHYREKLLLIDAPAQCFDFGNLPLHEDVLPARSDFGFPEGATIFVSGANFHQLAPELIDTWQRILAASRTSWLVLYPVNQNWPDHYPQQSFIDWLRQQFVLAGIDGKRIHILPQFKERRDAHRLLASCNIYLDSFPNSGMPSLIDALATPLPVVVLNGTRSRMAAAALSDLGLGNYVADSMVDYVALAQRLDQNASQRAEYVEAIDTAMKKRPQLLDGAWYGKAVGQQFEKILNKERNTFHSYLIGWLRRRLKL